MKKQQSNQYKSRETYQNAAGLLFGLSQDDEHDRLIKEQLLGQLTEKELKSYHLRRSGDWCGTNREERDIRRIKTILAASNNPHYKGFAVEYLQSQVDEWKPPSLWRKILHFLF